MSRSDWRFWEGGIGFIYMHRYFHGAERASQCDFHRSMAIKIAFL